MRRTVNAYLAILFITVFGAIATLTILRVIENDQSAYASTYQTHLKGAGLAPAYQNAQ